MTVATLEVAALCGVGPRMASEIDVAASHVESLARRVGAGRPRRRAGQDDRPRRSPARVPLIAGAGLTAPIAYRWKTQLNENAKLPAFAHELPELDHNEIVGWEGVGRARPVLGDLPRRQRPAPARPRAHRADRVARRAQRARDVPRRDARAQRGRAGVLARPARRPRLALLRRAARDRPGAGRGDRAPQGAARRALNRGVHQAADTRGRGRAVPRAPSCRRSPRRLPPAARLRPRRAGRRACARGDGHGRRGRRPDLRGAGSEVNAHRSARRPTGACRRRLRLDDRDPGRRLRASSTARRPATCPAATRAAPRRGHTTALTVARGADRAGHACYDGIGNDACAGGGGRVDLRATTRGNDIFTARPGRRHLPHRLGRDRFTRRPRRATTLSYATRAASASRVAVDGAAPTTARSTERDDVGTGIERIVGSRARDRLTGSADARRSRAATATTLLDGGLAPTGSRAAPGATRADYGRAHAPVTLPRTAAGERRGGRGRRHRRPTSRCWSGGAGDDRLTGSGSADWLCGRRRRRPPRRRRRRRLPRRRRRQRRRADYAARAAPVTVTLDAGAGDDGEAGEGDTVAASSTSSAARADDALTGGGRAQTSARRRRGRRRARRRPGQRPAAAAGAGADAARRRRPRGRASTAAPGTTCSTAAHGHDAWRR